MRYQFVDCRFDLADPTRGAELHEAGHIPGSSFLDLERDLSDMTRAPTEGRHPLPDAASFSLAASRAGIGANVHVVAYDDGSLAGAARLWWLLRHFGHDEVSLLAGGVNAWLGELERGHGAVGEASFEPLERTDDVIDAEELLERLDDDGLTIVDARAPERYRGEIEPLDPIAGRVPGALNVPFTSLSAGQSLPLQATENDEIVVYCGSGVTACVVVHALHRYGRDDARLYAGSYGEWSRRGLPTASGAESV